MNIWRNIPDSTVLVFRPHKPIWSCVPSAKSFVGSFVGYLLWTITVIQECCFLNFYWVKENILFQYCNFIYENWIILMFNFVCFQNDYMCYTHTQSTTRVQGGSYVRKSTFVIVWLNKSYCTVFNNGQLSIEFLTKMVLKLAILIHVALS